MDLDDYLEGGSDEIHKQLREGYGHIPKPQARKIRNYLVWHLRRCMEIQS
jgi:hypothetical protein